MVVNGGSSQQQPTPAPPPPPDVNNIMGGIEQTVGVRMHNHRRKLRQRFDLVRKLGQGTYGKVQLGINKETGQEVAIKTIKKAKIETEADLIRIRREIQIMSSVRHPNIIHIYEVFENKEKMVLVMEYAAGGELYDYLSQRKVLNEAEARRVFRQVASAVYYCHKHNICHRDLKLENILLDESKTAKIADFGLSNVFDDRRLLTTFCGSPLYASPEIVRGTPYHGPEVDCWSLGVLLYTLVYGAMPFDGSNFKRLVKQISSGEYYEPPDKPSTASPLVRHMLLVDPAKRANVEDICSHWWVNEGYGESCLEVAEELANQTPVRLDLLLSLVPPPESTDTVVVGAKTDQPPASTASKEGDSMNEYYSAAEPSSSDAAKTGGVKKKKESSGQSGKEADKASTVKRRRAETDQVKSADDSTAMTPDGRAGCPAVGDLDAANSAGPSPIDDSGIQTSLREEEESVTGVQSALEEEVRTKSTSNEAKTKCDVTDVDMDEGISTSSQADNRRSSVPVASCVANPASALAPCTIVTNNNNPSQSSSPSANATTTSTTSTSSIPHCSSISQQHSPATSAFRQTTTTVTVGVGDVSTSPPIAPTTANAEIEISRPPPPPLDGPTCAAAAPPPAKVPEAPESLLLVASTGQPESHTMAVKMDAKGAVPAANVVTAPEPENTVAPCSSTSPTNATPPPPPPPPPSLNQVPPPPPPSTLAPEKSESAGDSSGATTAGSSTATATPPKEEGAPSGSNRSESSAPNAPQGTLVALANRRPANTNKAAGPAAAAEQRHSKILRQAEIFNSLVLTHSRNEPSTTGPKSTMTLERPKKVTIFSYKLNDTRRPTETRTEPKVPTIVPVLKVSDAKRAFENNAAAAQQQRNSSISSAASGHHHNSLPRRTLIQTPASISTDAMVPKALNQQRAGHAASLATMTATTTAAQEAANSSQGVEPGEKVVVGGLGVKIGAIGKVTEIGMKVKTEENSHQTENQTTPKDTKTSPAQSDDSQVKHESSSSSASSEKKSLEEQSNAEQEAKVAEVASSAPVKEVHPSTKEKVSTKKVKQSDESPASTLAAKEPEEPKVREIPVMLDTGELEAKVASILVAPGRSPPKDPPAPRPTSLPTPVSSTPSPKTTGPVSASATERMTSPPPKPIRVASPPPLRIASPPPRPVRIASPSPPAAVANKTISSAPAGRTVSPPPPLIRPSADPSPNQRPLSPTAAAVSTLPSSRPMSPVYATSMTSTDRTDDDCIAGSENAFIRGIRSPTRDHPAPAAIPPLNKRFSKGPGDMPENAMVMVEAKPIQKAEINIAVNVASTSTNPRERIIPIRVEGRGESVAAAVGGLVASDSSKAVPKSLNSISVQLRATPPRVASPPPPPAQPIKPVPIRPSSASRQESIQNPGPAMATAAESVSSESKKFIREPIRESAREPIRKSPREFIIPITVEGVSASHPAATETASSSSASMRTSRFDRTKRYGSLYHEGETDFDISQPSGDVDNHAASPLHHLQRLSSFKKSHDEPETSRGRRGSDSSIDDDIDDDDDTFQILTAESLFSTLLSRVRQLTKRNQRAESNAADPFVVFRNSSRFTSPAPSAGGRSRATDVSDIHREFEDASSQMSSSGCTSPNAHHHHHHHNNNNNNNRNSTGSDLLAGSASNKGFWNNVYSRASSVASESDARRYSTLDPPRFHSTETPQLQQPSSAGVPSGLPWRRDTSVEGESSCSIASASMSQRGTAYHSPAVNGDVNNATPASSRPFTSSLTRRKLNQHLRETNPELVGSPGQNGNHQQNNSDAMSDASSTSAGNRSSLSWALSRFTGGVADSAKPTGRSVRDQQQPQYNRAKSSRELGNNEPQQRTYQRYGRSSTLDNLDPDSSTAPSSASTTGYFHRIGSPFSDDENPNSGVSTPASYRTYTRTRSREYMSPTSSRGTSPVPSSSVAAPPSISTTMSSPDAVANMTMNPIVPQLSTVLENGPLGVEGESSPRPTRAAESKLAAITSLNTTTTNPIPVSAPAPAPAPVSAPNPPAAPASENADGTIERKSRRVSRFLRPDFYDAPKEESSAEKQRFLKSVEQRWEKYNPDAGLMALTTKTTNNQTAGSTQTIERPAAPISKDRATGSVTSTPPSPLQPILKARQSLTPIPAPAQPNLSLPPPSSSVVLKPVPEQPQVEPTANKIQQQVTLKPVPVEPQSQQPQSAPKSNGNTPSSKNSPKLTVRRQFEHLINLAAAQFQRSSSPNKVAPAAPAQTPASSSTTITPPTPVVSTAAAQPPPTTVQQQPDTISLELKQLEDEIKNTAAIKAQASARLDALKYEHAVKSGAAAIPPSGIPKPAIPVKPIYLVARPVQEMPSVSPDLSIVPPEFQPFQYKGSNGTLRELSHRSNNNNRRDALSPPPAGNNENGTISPFADEAVRFARIIKRFESQPYENSWASDAMGIDNAAPGTPTDSYESSSVCSDLRGDQRDSGEDESVSERIFRKSFYSRFNEPTKTKHRRSMTRELDGGEGGEGNLPMMTDAQPPISRRSSQNRKSLSGRDESVDRIGLSETVMVRKFLSSGDANGGGNFDRERRLSASRRHPSVSEYSADAASVDVIHPRRSMSREVSVARSVKSDTQPPQVTSPTPSVAGSDSGDRRTSGREVRSYARTYSSSRALANDLPPSGNGESYSSASLGRRSYYPVSSTSSSSNADHISSLPRRSSNRYSIHEHVPESTNVRLRSTGSSVLASRPSRYSSILLEESGGSGSATTGHQISNVLSPNSTRRHTNLSDSGLTRRESTFYGTPSPFSSRPGAGAGGGSTTGSTSTYFLRSTSSGLDHHNNNSTNHSGTYSTLRPSLLRHRR